MKTVIVPNGKRREYEEEVTSTPFLVVRRQVGIASYRPLMPTKGEHTYADVVCGSSCCSTFGLESARPVSC